MFFFSSSFLFFSFSMLRLPWTRKKTTYTEKKLKWEKCFPAAEASPSRSSGRLRQNTRPYSLTVSEAILPVVFFGCSLSFVLFSFFSVKGCVWLRYFIMFASSSSVAGTGREKEKKRKWWGCLVFFSPFTVGKRRIVPTGSQLSGMTAIISHLCFGCILYCKLQYICRQGILLDRSPHTSTRWPVDSLINVWTFFFLSLPSSSDSLILGFHLKRAWVNGNSPLSCVNFLPFSSCSPSVFYYFGFYVRPRVLWRDKWTLYRRTVENY